jgi:hypothetical protein
MNAASKLTLVLIAAILGFGLVACGEDDDSGSTATDTASQGPAQNGKGDDGGGQDGTTTADAGGEDDSDSGDGAGSGPSGDSGQGGSGSGGRSDDFVPKPHDDSGGGSTQYRVKGGDNSVQEFGAEAEDAEREAAARAVHNFLDARAQEAWEAACTYLATEVRESLEEFAVKAQEAAAKQGKAEQFDDTSCASILGRLTNRAALPELREEAAQADVGSLRVEGDRAFVIYTGLRGTVIAIPVAKEDDGWKVAALGGTPLS